MVRAGVARRGDALVDGQRQARHADTGGQRVGLGHHAAHEDHDFGLRVHLGERRAGERGHRVPAQAADHLGPDPGADVGHDLRVQAGRSHGLVQACDARAGRPVGLADGKAQQVAIVMHHTRFDHLGGNPVDAAQRALGPEPAPLFATRVQPVDLPAGVRARQAVEVPIRDAGGGWQHGGVRAEQRGDAVECRRHLVLLQRDEDHVLRPQVGRPVGGRHAGRYSALRRHDPQPAFADRRQVRTACDDTHVEPGHLGQPGGDKTADGAGTEDANLHAEAPIRKTPRSSTSASRSIAQARK